MRVHPQLRALFGAWDEAQVVWTLLRGEQFLAAPEGDVDVLVAADDLAVAEEVLFAIGYVAMPRRATSWHRFYLLRDAASRSWITVDVVTRLTYGRGPVIPSNLEAGVLARRRSVAGVSLLQGCDQFWTVVLHCMLDKGFVSGRRAEELTRLLPAVRRPSDGEAFLARLLDTSAGTDAVLAAVAAGDWARVVAPRSLLQGNGDIRQASGGANPSGSDPGRGGPSLRTRLARRVYTTLWRRAGLGAAPAVADVVEACGVDAAVIEVRRRPLLHEVSLLVHERQIPVLVAGLREHGFRRLGGSWWRPASGRVERVLVDGTSRRIPSEAAANYAFATARAVPGHEHWLAPSASTRLLLAARSLQNGAEPVCATALGTALEGLRGFSDRSWEEARQAAGSWGVATELSAVAVAVGAP